MSHELIAVLIFSSMMLMLLTGQRVFGAIGGVATLFALMLWGKGGAEIAVKHAVVCSASAVPKRAASFRGETLSARMLPSILHWTTP